MPAVNLKPVRRAAKKHNRYCGPAAVSIIAGVDTAEAAAVIRHASGKRSIKGTTHWDILRSLNLLGYRAKSAAKVDPLNPKANPTLAAWLKSDARDGQALYLVAAGHHWQVVQGRRFCCGLTGKIVSIRDEKVKRRARVTAVYQIEQERKVALADVLPAKAKAKDSDATVRRKAKRLAAEHGVEIEVERTYDGFSNIIVWGPTWAPGVDEEDADPFYGNHYAEDWADALARVEDYAELIRARPEVVA